ncbi:ATP-binding protein [Actinomadura macrotermitis]|uniref:Histidine kinase/HSP90-like ATPase domain-containing protein n=1 Tax=Actinomadura macrotermitis TaxID=2585200 RepID=A0A7K0C0M4_9ACTN|nr:ATP-binding protein [Actinomadura macrotermitis]MQY06997.1 hypothetical protein [Actinomadura macrotermitis]
MITGNEPTQNFPLGESVELMIDSVPESAKKVRDLVALWCRYQGYGEELTEVARVVATELTTNAYRHASVPGQSILARAYVSDVGPVIEVWDHSDELPVVQPFDLASESGRGLAMVELMVRRFGVDLLAGGGKCVYAVLPQSGRPGTAPC